MRKLRSLAPWFLLVLLTGLFAACGLLALKAPPKTGPRILFDRR